MMKFFDLSDPFYAPLQIRISIVVLTAAWGLLELSSGAFGWAMVFWGVSAYCAWQFATIDYGSDKED